MAPRMLSRTVTLRRGEDMREHGMRNESPVKPAMCMEYEALLKQSHVALTNWKNGRAEIRRSGRKGRKADNELRVLQASFAKAYAALQYHARDCEVCRVASLINSRLAASSAASSYPLHQ
jgi:hypothetical protein